MRGSDTRQATSFARLIGWTMPMKTLRISAAELLTAPKYEEAGQDKDAGMKSPEEKRWAPLPSQSLQEFIAPPPSSPSSLPLLSIRKAT